MLFNYRELKKLLYIAQTLLGVVFIVLAWFQFNVSMNAAEGVLNFIVAITLLVAGLLCVLFGLDAYLLRGEADIWY
jgi:ammonia channel protein AmtB